MSDQALTGTLQAGVGVTVVVDVTVEVTVSVVVVVVVDDTVASAGVTVEHGLVTVVEVVMVLALMVSVA